MEHGKMRWNPIAMRRIVDAAQRVQPRKIRGRNLSCYDQRAGHGSSILAPSLPDLQRTSDFNLASKLDHTIGRQFEKLHRAFSVAQHPGEQLLAPNCHSGPR